MSDQVQILTTWRPATWCDGSDDIGAPDEGHTPENVFASHQQYVAAGYYRRGNKVLSDKGQAAKDSQTAADIAHNVALLRDSWCTNPRVWRLAEKLTGVTFRVDPFWNPFTDGLPGLVRTLDNSSRDLDGLLTLRQARLIRDTDVSPDEFAFLVERIAALDGRPDDFPVNWRGNLTPGSAPAAANGPHSCTEDWLKLADAYGREEIVATFVPDAGDAWFETVALRAQLVVRLGRIYCQPAPGIPQSSPRGPSALAIWIPDSYDRKLLPKPTQQALKGKALKVPLFRRKIKGIQYAYVQLAGHDPTDKGVDFGLLDG